MVCKGESRWCWRGVDAALMRGGEHEEHRRRGGARRRGALAPGLALALICLAALALSALSQDVHGDGQSRARVEWALPDAEEGMMQESGSLVVAFTLFNFLSGSMRVRVNQTLVNEQVADPGKPSDDAEAGEYISWEIYGLIPDRTYQASVDFFKDGQVIETFTRTSLMLPYRDPFEDPPQVEVGFPAGQGNVGYPAILGEDRATIEVRTVDRRPVRAGQGLAVVTTAGVAGWFGRANMARTSISYPPDSYRRMCPTIVPQMVMAVLFTSDGNEVLAASRPVLFWVGKLNASEVANLPSLVAIPDHGEHTVVYETIDGWTQEARPMPRAVLQDGSLGGQVEGLPRMGFMSATNPNGFQPGEDFGAIGYERPAPGGFKHLWMRAPEGRRVTVVIASCGRLAGLRRTISSLLAANDYPVDRWVLVEDSGDWRMAASLIEEFGDVFDILVNKRRMGQLFSLDKAYSVVETDYIFHVEDDWVFNGIPHFIRDSVSVLAHEPRAFTVHLCNTSFLYPIDDFAEVTPEAVEYHRIMASNPEAKTNPGKHIRAYSFTFHPGLRRKSDYDTYLAPMQSFFQEDNINTFLFWKGFFMVKFGQRYCNHLDINSISRHMEYHIKNLEFSSERKHDTDTAEADPAVSPGEEEATTWPQQQEGEDGATKTKEALLSRLRRNKADVHNEEEL